MGMNPLQTFSVDTVDVRDDLRFGWHALSTLISGLEWVCGFCGKPAIWFKEVDGELVDACKDCMGTEPKAAA